MLPERSLTNLQLFVSLPLSRVACRCPYLITDGSEMMGERLVVQFARGSNRPPRDFDHPGHRPPPRPRRTVHRMTINGLPSETSWQVRTSKSERRNERDGLTMRYPHSPAIHVELYADYCCVGSQRLCTSARSRCRLQ